MQPRHPEGRAGRIPKTKDRREDKEGANERNMKISLIVTTYNWPDALRLSLLSAKSQTRIPDEVIVADDGSGEETRALIAEMARDFPCPLKHAWQEDRGFRASESRNNALRRCEGDYVVFIDGDIIMERHFVENHADLAEAGFFVIGSRARLSEKLTERLLRDRSIRVGFHTRGVSRRLNALYLPVLSRMTTSYKRGRRLYGRSCNMAVFYDDLLRVNGFDADLEGYGFEDTDLIARLNNLGLQKKFAKFQAIEYHLHHREKAFEANNELIFKRNLTSVACKNGIRRLP